MALLVEQAAQPVARRSHHKADAAQAAAQPLFPVAASWEVQGEREREREASQTGKARTAQLARSSGRVRWLPPRQQAKTDPRPLVGSVVRVWDPQPPEGSEGLSWLLLTSVPVQQVEQAWQRGDWDRARWLVED